MLVARTAPPNPKLALPVLGVAPSYKTLAVRKLMVPSNKGDSESLASTTVSRGVESSIPEIRTSVGLDSLLDALLDYRAELSYKRALGESLTAREKRHLAVIDAKVEKVEKVIPSTSGLSEQTLAAIDLVLGR